MCSLHMKVQERTTDQCDFFRNIPSDIKEGNRSVWYLLKHINKINVTTHIIFHLIKKMKKKQVICFMRPSVFCFIYLHLVHSRPNSWRFYKNRNDWRKNPSKANFAWGSWSLSFYIGNFIIRCVIHPVGTEVPTTDRMIFSINNNSTWKLSWVNSYTLPANMILIHI